MTHKFCVPVLYLLTVLVVWGGLTGAAGCAPPAEQQAIRVRFGENKDPVPEAFFHKRGIPFSRLAYMVYDPKTGQVLASHNRRRICIPASVIKIPAMLFALEILGPDYRFPTKLYAAGPIRDGVLEGDLILKGYGDPGLWYGHLLSMAQALAGSGIRRVRGRFLYDESHYQSVNSIAPDMEQDAHYNPGLSPLSLGYNMLYAQWEAGWTPGTNGIFVSPCLPGWSSRVGKGVGFSFPARFAYHPRKNGTDWEMIGTYTSAWRHWLPVKQPARYCATAFRMFARMLGTELPSPQPGNVPGGAQVVHTHHGPDVLTLAETALEHSNNLVSEMLLLGAARHLYKRSLDLEQAAAELKPFLAGRIKGVAWDSFRAANGSGLTSASRCSMEQLLAVLCYAHKRRYRGRSLLSLLPYGGSKGSLKYRLNRPGVALRVWAKPGAIYYAVSLAGYFFSKRNRMLLFVLSICDLPLRRAMDKARRVGSGNKALAQAPGWTEKYMNIGDRLVADWVERW